MTTHPNIKVSFHHQSILDGNSCYKQLLGTKKVSLGRGGTKTCWLMYWGGSNYHLLSLLVFCYCICTWPCCCRSFHLSLCCLLLFHLSYVALLRQCTCSLSESTLTVPQFSCFCGYKTKEGYELDLKICMSPVINHLFINGC